MLAQDAMTGAVVTLSPHDTLRDAIELFRSHRIRHLPVVEDSKLVGIVTDRDVKRVTPSLLSGVAEEEYDAALQTITVTKFMIREPVTVTRKTGLRATIGILLETRVGALPVVDDGHLVGIVTETDILRIAHDLLRD